MNTCYTYFKIIGNFDPEEISKLLQMTPYESCKTGSLAKDGISTHKYSVWKSGKCTEYDANILNMIKKTIAPLRNKTELLRYIKENYGASLYIVVVPQLYVNDVAPVIGPDMEIIDFCAAARAEIDVDLYLYNL